jgi:hypothetical protein
MSDGEKAAASGLRVAWGRGDSRVEGGLDEEKGPWRKRQHRQRWGGWKGWVGADIFPWWISMTFYNR